MEWDPRSVEHRLDPPVRRGLARVVADTGAVRVDIDGTGGRRLGSEHGVEFVLFRAEIWDVANGVREARPATRSRVGQDRRVSHDVEAGVGGPRVNPTPQTLCSRGDRPGAPGALVA